MSEMIKSLADFPENGWAWMNEPEEWSITEKKSITITASHAADFFNDPATSSNVSSAPFLYTPVTADFTAVTQLSVVMKEQCDSACLMMWQDEKNWAKICFEYMDKQPSIVTVITRGRSDDCISRQLTAPNPWLRLTRFGDLFAFLYSEDGMQWNVVRYFQMDMLQEVKVGVVVQAPFGAECKAVVHSFDIYVNTNEDVRVVDGTVRAN